MDLDLPILAMRIFMATTTGESPGQSASYLIAGFALIKSIGFGVFALALSLFSMPEIFPNGSRGAISIPTLSLIGAAIYFAAFLGMLLRTRWAEYMNLMLSSMWVFLYLIGMIRNREIRLATVLFMAVEILISWYLMKRLGISAPSLPAETRADPLPSEPHR